MNIDGSVRIVDAQRSSLKAGRKATVNSQIHTGNVSREWTREEGDGISDLI
ncbi:MAG TPA: hypothetical protein VF447_05300 [Terriglobales bacterium]